jgi:hypothetical protein
MTQKCDNCGNEYDDDTLRCICGREITSNSDNASKKHEYLTSYSVKTYKMLKLSLILILASGLFVAYFKSYGWSVLRYPVIIFYCFQVVYLVQLGILINRTNRNTLLWVLLTLVFNIPGFIVSFFMMQKIAKESNITD